MTSYPGGDRKAQKGTISRFKTLGVHRLAAFVVYIRA